MDFSLFWFDHLSVCGPDVIKHKISDYLSVKDMYNLSLTSKYFLTLINEKFLNELIVKKITGNLKKVFEEDYASFARMMHETGGVISGSFILQCILNEKWENSDIDIYFDEKVCPAFYYKYRDVIEHVKGQLPPKYMPMELFSDNLVENFDNFYNGNPYISYTVSTDYNNHRLQFIYIETSKDHSLHDHVRITGFDICRNSLSFGSDLGIVVSLHNLKAILNKHVTFSVLGVDDFFYRVEKYSKRGFTFRPKFNKLLILEYILLKHCGCQNVRKAWHSCNTNGFTLEKVPINNNEFKHSYNSGCYSTCPIKFLYPKLRHNHTYEHRLNRIWIPSNERIFDSLISNYIGELNLNHFGELSFNIYYYNMNHEDSIEFGTFIKDCRSVDQYLEKRNSFVFRKNRTNSKNFNNSYDLKFEIEEKIMNPVETVEKLAVIKSDSGKKSFKDMLLKGL